MKYSLNTDPSFFQNECFDSRSGPDLSGCKSLLLLVFLYHSTLQIRTNFCGFRRNFPTNFLVLPVFSFSCFLSLIFLHFPLLIYLVKIHKFYLLLLLVFYLAINKNKINKLFTCLKLKFKFIINFYAYLARCHAFY